jgi:hypothetical protein
VKYSLAKAFQFWTQKGGIRKIKITEDRSGSIRDYAAIPSPGLKIGDSSCNFPFPCSFFSSDYPLCTASHLAYDIAGFPAYTEYLA